MGSYGCPWAARGSHDRRGKIGRKLGSRLVAYSKLVSFQGNVGSTSFAVIPLDRSPVMHFRRRPYYVYPLKSWPGSLLIMFELVSQNVVLTVMRSLTQGREFLEIERGSLGS
ncbi:hypothetical protein CRG98_045214 [Punica granatum]|uniref:Uncharacterized protein n=1 Tax=Punica granatum TaxID=22663 RepID=A0A2I0HS32_PUNGR|nr:hypothetical protein CRG98_045214 [Punica granatum]